MFAPSYRSWLSLLVVVGSLLLQEAHGASSEPSSLTNIMGDPSLASPQGRLWSLAELMQPADGGSTRGMVVAFLGTECPLAQLYTRRLAELAPAWRARGIVVVAIDANPQDSLRELDQFAQAQQLPFPLLKDVDQTVANALQATRTPEVFLLDDACTTRYHGRIDDQYGIGFTRPAATRHDLQVAVDELLNNQPISVPETPFVGCRISRSKPVSPTGSITYNREISRIFNRRCVECHRAGELAPFPLTSYQEVVGWEETIREVISENRMPPWSANPAHGQFSNDPRLTDTEKEQIATWIADGMPEGDPFDLPSPREFVAGWRIGQPDQVFTMRETPFEVPATGVVDYQYFEVDPGWTEDKYIRAAEARPDNRSVVHHILVYIIPPGTAGREPRSILVGYAPGSTPIQLRDHLAIPVPAGSKLLFQMHYTPNGYAQTDRSYAGVRFVDKQQVHELLEGRMAINQQFTIPPQAADHAVTAEYRAHRDEWLQSMTPHMHLRGKSFRYEATYPDGRQETLLDVPRYDFNWQMKYILAEPKLLPRGTRIECIAHYDNSTDNRSNPNPATAVRWGDQSWEEMMIGFFDVVPVAPPAEPPLSHDVQFDPSGRWRWSRRQGEATVEDELQLTLRDQKLTGQITTLGQTNTPGQSGTQGQSATQPTAWPIQQGRVVGDQLTFSLRIPEFPGVTIEFAATVHADRLEGQATFQAPQVGQSRSFPWNPQRVAAP